MSYLIGSNERFIDLENYKMIKTAWDNREICDHILNTNFPPLRQVIISIHLMSV